MVRALPDDGNRYELVSGRLLVTPAPAYVHQALVLALYNRFHPWLAGRAIGEVMLSPADIGLGDDEILQPDLFVFPPPRGGRPRTWADITSLLLAVEVLSPTTARHDRTLKRLRYQQALVPEYWIVDPDARAVERWRPESTVAERVTGRITWRPAPDGDALEVDLAAVFAAVLGEA